MRRKCIFGFVTHPNGGLSLCSESTLRALDPSKNIVAFIERKDVPALKPPTGNESPFDVDSGANKEWTPGMKTLNGVTEAVMSFPLGTDLKKVVTELTIGL